MCETYILIFNFMTAVRTQVALYLIYFFFVLGVRVGVLKAVSATRLYRVLLEGMVKYGEL